MICTAIQVEKIAIIDQENRKNSPKASLITSPAIERSASASLSAQILSPFFLVGLPFGFGIGLDRLALTSQQLFPCFDQRFGSSAQLRGLFIHVIEILIASLTNIFPRFFSRAGRQQ
jgi:hypothetical protein